eukprot:GHVR01015825.1.p1 GENE.GHVR01015825.1~~GHVR01015825.1.p1  ORF type:complete len:343 (-),score=36.83 GHVR01015825.1:116-1144(-)
MNPFVLFLFVTFPTTSLVFGNNDNPYKLLDASELRRKYVLQRFLGDGHSASVYLINERESGSEKRKREFALKYRFFSQRTSPAINELKALRFVTDNDIPFASHLVGAYRCPIDMDIAEGTQEYFTELLQRQFKDEYKLNTYKGLSRYPIEFPIIEEQVDERRSMCYVIQYASNGTLKDKRDEFMNRVDNKGKDEYAKSLRKWTIQVLTSLHYIHLSKYLKYSHKGENVVIDASDNSVVIDFGRSSLPDENDRLKLQKTESMYVFSLLIAHCGENINLDEYINQNPDWIRENVSLELCQKNWKKWNNKGLVAVLMDWMLSYFERADEYTAEQILLQVFGTTPM